MSALSTQYKPQPNKPVIGSLPLWKIYAAYTAGEIVAYEKNRGGQGINKTAVKEMLENFDPLALGLLQAAVVEDRLVLCDWHHRMALLQDAFAGGLVAGAEDVVVPVKIFHEDDFLRIYSRTNKNRGHSLAEKTRNSDLPLGGYLERLLNDVDVELNASGYTNLADVALAYHFHKTKITLQDIFSARSDTRNYANRIAGEITELEQDSTKMLVAALKYYKAFQAGIQRFATKDPVAAKTLVKTPGLLMFILKDYLTERSFTHNDPNFVAYCALSNNGRVLEESQCVARRNMKYINEERLADYLNGVYERGSRNRLLKSFSATFN